MTEEKKSVDTINNIIYMTEPVKCVIKRDGREVPVEYDKITRRIQNISQGLDVDPVSISSQVVKEMVNRMHVSKLDELAARTAANMAVISGPDYGTLAARLMVSNLHKETPSLFSDAILMVHLQKYPLTDEDRKGRIVDGFYDAKFVRIVRKHAHVLDAAIRHENDYQYDYFGTLTLLKAYLNKVAVDSKNFRIIERPQYMLMRVALFLNQDNIQEALRTYASLSAKQYIHASPTLVNAGKKRSQCSSCFLLTMKEDSIDGIYDTLKQTALISKNAGGIGLAVHNIRAKGSVIRTANGPSHGLVPMLKVFESTARYCDQGSTRKGAFAIYLEPWHADIEAFLKLRHNRGKESLRTRDLFLGLWIPDLFMERVEKDENWTLFCPDKAPGLQDVWGEKFVELYTKYEREGRGNVTMKAQALWRQILNAQTETGTPYVLYKDACNRKSNQQNLGTIHSSNLCTEIVEFTAPDEVAVCNLASIALPSCVEEDTNNNFIFNHQKLYDIAFVAIRNLDRVIDLNYYPVPEAKRSNTRHRPVGLGVSGLADVFAMMRYPYESAEAQQLNREIFETIYFAALSSSLALAKANGPYSTYAGSPISQGILQFDMWNVKPTARWNWTALREEIGKYGVRNSLLVAPMPTATTAQIVGYNDCFEPFTRNIYMRSTQAGEFVVFNPYLVKDLKKRNLWNEAMIQKIVAQQGSIQNIEELSAHEDLKLLYKTVYEMKTKPLIDMAADRGAFICQSQSFNLYLSTPTVQMLNTIHMYTWKKGLKTGMYYLRSQSAIEPIQFSLDAEMAQRVRQKQLGFANESSVIQPKSVTDEEEDTATAPSTPKTAAGTPKRQKPKNVVCTDEVCTSCQG